MSNALICWIFLLFDAYFSSIETYAAHKLCQKEILSSKYLIFLAYIYTLPNTYDDNRIYKHIYIYIDRNKAAISKKEGDK